MVVDGFFSASRCADWVASVYAGREAWTSYRVLQRLHAATRVEALLHTEGLTLHPVPVDGVLAALKPLGIEAHFLPAIVTPTAVIGPTKTLRQDTATVRVRALAERRR